MKLRTFILSIILTSGISYAQTVPTAADFLRLQSNIRAAGMGNLGVASGSHESSVFSNPALIPFNGTDYEKEVAALALTYSPLAASLSKDIKALTLNGQYWIGTDEYIGLSLQYLSIGDVKFYDKQANETAFIIPSETAIGGTYSRKFNENFALGVTLKGIISKLTDGAEYNALKTNNAFTMAADVGLYGSRKNGASNELNYGVAITNLGGKLGYSSQQKSFLPTTLRLGLGYSVGFNENYFRLGLELNKLLVPSLPVYDEDNQIVSGSDPDRSVPAAIFSSFGDHPQGMSGELKEIGWSIGAEIGLNQTFFLRTGYYYENPMLGQGSSLSFGLGFRRLFSSKRLGIDMAYIFPSGDNLSMKSSFKLGLSFAILD